MPDSIMTLFPLVLNEMESMKIPLELSANVALEQIRALSAGFDMAKNVHDTGLRMTRQFVSLTPQGEREKTEACFDLYRETTDSLYHLYRKSLLQPLIRYYQERTGELDFIRLFTDALPQQDWSDEVAHSRVLLDLPSMKLIDISADVNHTVENYTVVFAPRAGHHSNIAERVALYLRSCGLTRMAIVEQKCAEDIPLLVDGTRHHENFDGQVEQYRRILQHLRDRAGYPSHLVAVCQPGPLLMTTLILNPELGKTFGSAGSPMDTDAERGFLTDFCRAAGAHYMENLDVLFGRKVREERTGSGRDMFDGRLHVLGFYLLSSDMHARNFRRLLDDLKKGKVADAQRQMAFYQWYNFVQCFPTSFIEDTYKRIFVKNELIRGKLTIDGRRVDVADYPGSVPIWALGGAADNIAPPLQATGHMKYITSVPDSQKLTLICDGGHMALFRSEKVLREHYTRIAAFMLDHSDIHSK
ncbi:MAG: DUF3141 domain-containing protein [Deltaproteobacteria bacterium]|nr:DUF3141 domain-containing protein [Deltaproteobacteria bacterium]